MNKMLLPILALLLSACATPEPRCPMIANEGRYCLQPLSAIAPFSAQQKIEMQFKARNETMLALIEVDSDALRFAALSPFGQKLMQVQCTDTHIEAPLWPDDRLDPALFCAMLQLSLWPDDSVRAGLQAPLQMESGVHTRRIDSRDEFYEFFTSPKVAEGQPTPIHAGFALTHFSGEVELEKQIKDDLSVTVRCIPLEHGEPGTCPFTGKPSSQRVVWAKAY